MQYKNDSVMLELVSVALFGFQTDITADWETDSFARELLMQAVFPIAISAAPEALRTKWSKHSNEIVAAKMTVSYEHTELHDLLTQKEIPYVILKGAASASYYPTPILRTMGDVDFLVRPEDVARAGRIST